MKTRTSDEVALVQQEPAQVPLRMVARGLLFALLLVASWCAAFIFWPSPGRVNVVVGEPSPRDIKAPRQITYISQARTDTSRALAASKVGDVYTNPDMGVATKQLGAIQDIADYITAIRYDAFADAPRKLALIREIPALELSPEVLSSLVGLDEDGWQSVITETLRVLDLTMREEIREGEIDDARSRVQRLTTHTLSDEQQRMVIALTQSMIVPNSFFDARQTELNRQAAREEVDPVLWTIREGESVLREGEIVTDLALEKLEVLGLLNASVGWQDSVGIVLFCLAIVVALSTYVARSQPLLLSRPKRELLLLLLLVAVGLAARMAIPGHTLIPYVFPAAAVTMLVSILLNVELAMVTSSIVAVIVGFSAGGSMELVVYVLVGSMIGALVTWRMDHLGAFVRAAAYVALANATVILAFRLHSQLYDALGLVQLLAMALANAVLSASLVFVAFSLVGRLFGITTSLQLLELARPTQTLFRQLLIQAPGTYHHSIVISNMAERAAQAIGADALLARVGCYYHDIGKISRPYFFAENQSDGENPHDKLDPKTSAEIIIAHTADGLALARRHGLPRRIWDFIAEHHGTTLVSYFHQRAIQESGNEPVDDADFRYPGPRPQTKETAIVMLADSVEACVRANRPSTQSEMEHIIHRMISNRLMDGQLDECDLTLKDLDRVRAAFNSVLQGIFHPRIEYPEAVHGPTPQNTSGSS